MGEIDIDRPVQLLKREEAFRRVSDRIAALELEIAIGRFQSFGAEPACGSAGSAAAARDNPHRLLVSAITVTTDLHFMAWSFCCFVRNVTTYVPHMR